MKHWISFQAWVCYAFLSRSLWSLDYFLMCVTLKKGSDWLKLCYVEIWWVRLCFLDICFDQFVLKTDCEDESFFGNIFGQYVLKTSSRRPEDILSRRIFSWIFVFPINLKGALKTCLFLTVSERIFFAVICFE